MFSVKLNKINMSIFHPLEVVSRCSDTQLQVGGNLNYLFKLLVKIIFTYK